MRGLLPAGAVSRARTLRRASTDAEQMLWRGLRESLPSAHFRRQVVFGPYFADFASHAAKLVVEVDGGQHADAEEHDRERTRFLNGEGYRVLRFWNNDVLENLDGVLKVIADALPNSLSPLVGERLERGVHGKAARAPKARTPHPLPAGRQVCLPGKPKSLPAPTRGEGGSVKSVDLESV